MHTLIEFVLENHQEMMWIFLALFTVTFFQLCSSLREQIHGPCGAIRVIVISLIHAILWFLYTFVMVYCAQYIRN